MEAIEIIRDIKNKIAFQSGSDEECANYALFGNTLVRIAINRASKETIEHHLGEKMKNIQILSIIFANKVNENESKIYFPEYVFNPEQMTNDDVNAMIRFFQKLSSGETWTTSI